MLSILVATAEGGSRLPALLDALAVSIAGINAEILLADNGPRPHAAEVVASLPDLPIRVLHRPRVKSEGLNALVDVARGELLAFTDDDARPSPRWARALLDAAAQQPTYDVFAGPVQAAFPTEPPMWWHEVVPFSQAFAHQDPRPEGPLPWNWVWGVNMALRRRVFDEGLRFDPRLGPGTDLRGDDVDLVLRAARRGHASWHVPTAVVTHELAEGRTDPAVLTRVAEAHGRYTVVLEHGWSPGPRQLLPALARASASVALEHGIRRRATARQDEVAELGAQWRLAYARGRAAQLRRLALSRAGGDR